MKSRSSGCIKFTHTKQKLDSLRGGSINYCNSNSVSNIDSGLIIGIISGSTVGIIGLILFIIMIIFAIGTCCACSLFSAAPKGKTIPSRRETNYKPPPPSIELQNRERPPPTAPYYYEEPN